MTKIFFTFSTLSLFFVSQSLKAASFSLGGNYRLGSNMFHNMDLDVTPSEGYSTTFWEHRFLLKPDVIIDDRFAVRSELNMYQQPRPTGGDPNHWQDSPSPENFGSTLGASGGGIYVRRAWLDWNSDFGVFRVGRMPKNWGLGILYHSGLGANDDFGSTVDRVSFEGLVGNLKITASFEKQKEGQAHIDADDMESYEGTIEYTNPENSSEVGLLYAKSLRGPSSNSWMVGSHDFSIYTRQKLGKFNIAGELVAIGQDRRSTSTGLLTQVDYKPSTSWSWGLDFGFASGASDAPFVFHPNYKPFLILYNQSLANSYSQRNIRGGFSGMPVGSAPNTNYTGLGAYLTKVSSRYLFQSGGHVLGFDFGNSYLTRLGTNDGRLVGYEFDSHFTQKWYDNFSTSYAIGFLFPGKAFGWDSKFAWGFQLRGTLVF